MTAMAVEQARFWIGLALAVAFAALFINDATGG